MTTPTPTQKQREQAYLAITKDGVLLSEAILVEVVATLLARVWLEDLLDNLE